MAANRWGGLGSVSNLTLRLFQLLFAAISVATMLGLGSNAAKTVDAIGWLMIACYFQLGWSFVLAVHDALVLASKIDSVVFLKPLYAIILNTIVDMCLALFSLATAGACLGALGVLVDNPHAVYAAVAFALVGFLSSFTSFLLNGWSMFLETQQQDPGLFV